jgi:FkbM family methyltransferase
MARTVGPAGRVIGFEAVPELAARTRDAIARHHPDTRSQIELHNVAVSDHAGIAEFHYSKANDGGLSGLANRPVLAIGPVETIQVPVTTIDDTVDADFLSRLDFAKFDIEGAEYHAFLGARRVLSRQPIMSFEWDREAPTHFHYQPADLVGLLGAHGYRIYDLFGFAYPDVESLTSARVWNFVAVPRQNDARYVLQPSLETFLAAFPHIVNG